MLDTRAETIIAIYEASLQVALHCHVHVSCANAAMRSRAAASDQLHPLEDEYARQHKDGHDEHTNAHHDAARLAVLLGLNSRNADQTKTEKETTRDET